MSEESNVFNTIINYEPNKELPIEFPHIGFYQVIDGIAESKFDIQKKRIIDVMGNRTFVVPDYQRIYSWEEEQHHEVWQEVQKLFEAEVEHQENPDLSDVFFGSMYFATTDESDKYEIIDGQQRITTLAILFRVILEHAESAVDELSQDDELREPGKNIIDQLKNILYEFKMAGRETSFKLNKHDREFFNHLLLGENARLNYLLSDKRERIDGRRGEAAQVKKLIKRFKIKNSTLEKKDIPDNILTSYIPLHKSNERLLEAYEFYFARIKQILENEEDPRARMVVLLNLSNYVQRSFFIGHFEISDTGSEFRMQIFEILNDRGIDLTKIDRIRANVVNRFSGEDQEEEYIAKWEEVVGKFGTDATQIETFLGVYLAGIDPNIDSRSDARNNLTRAFSMRTPPSVNVEPRLSSVSEAQQLIDEIHDNLEYYEHITNPELDDNQLKLDDAVRTPSEDILKRLNNLGTSQWLPLVLYTYRHTHKQPNSDSQFYKLLRTVENITIRLLLADVNPNVAENLFVDACTEFRQYNEEDRHQPYEDVINYLINSLEADASQLFGRTFADAVIRYLNWSDTYSKQFLWKIAAAKFQEEGESVDKYLNISNLHLEHVLPKKLVGNDGDSTWMREFFKTNEADLPISQLAIEYVQLNQDAKDSHQEEVLERLDDIEQFIRRRFVMDIANCLLLKSGDNIAAGNAPLSQKIIKYYRTNDFDEIFVNKFFTAENPDFPEGHKDQLLAQYESGRGGIDNVDDQIRQKLDGFWNYERFRERRVDLVMELLSAIEFDNRTEEFDFDRTYVQQEMDEEINRRLEARSL